MSYVKKTWKDRVSEYSNRRILTDTSSGTTQTVTIARAEGTISQEGDSFSAANMNNLETRIENGFNSIDLSKLTNVTFKVTKNASGGTLSTPITFSIVSV